MILSHDWGNGIERERSRRRRLKLNMLKFPNPPYFFQNIEGRTDRSSYSRVYASLRLRGAQIPNEFVHGRFLLQAGRRDEKANWTRNYLKLLKGLKRICQP
jgi:hypothetical protein